MNVLTVKEVAKMLGCCEVKVYAMVANGEIYPVGHIGKKIIISQMALDAFVTGVDLHIKSNFSNYFAMYRQQEVAI